MMTKINPRVQRKEEESQLMLEDWCWNLKKVCVAFSLATGVCVCAGVFFSEVAQLPFPSQEGARSLSLVFTSDTSTAILISP